MSTLAVVQHLRNLAADPQNRATIVKDQSCLAGLVLFLDNENVNVVTTALEALKFLSEHVPNRTIMQKEMGMVVSLKNIISMEGYNFRARELAKEILNIIVHPTTTPGRTSRMSSTTNSFFLCGNKKAKVITLQVKGMTNQMTRKICEEQLLKIRGVISFTFDLHKSRCTVRVKPEITPGILCDSIGKTKVLSAQQVVKNEHGEEIMLSFGTNPGGMCPRNSSSLPDYLPEDDDEFQVSDKAITKTGEKGKDNGGWFGSVTSFISQSLYW